MALLRPAIQLFADKLTITPPKSKTQVSISHSNERQDGFEEQ